MGGLVNEKRNTEGLTRVLLLKLIDFGAVEESGIPSVAV